MIDGSDESEAQRMYDVLCAITEGYWSGAAPSMAAIAEGAALVKKLDMRTVAPQKAEVGRFELVSEPIDERAARDRAALAAPLEWPEP